MIQTIIFSRNRAAQLDLLLRSISERAPMLQPLYVIYKADSMEFNEGYLICEAEHTEAIFMTETNLQEQVRVLLKTHQEIPAVTFLCDDDLIVRPFIDDPVPEVLLDNTAGLLCVSLRLGLNTTRCYPYDREQDNPGWEIAFKEARMWNWSGQDGDWGYPGSIDGHVFRRADLLDLLVNQPFSSAFQIFSNPNELEEILNSNCKHLNRTLMACYAQSVLTGVPVNRVNTTHPNRYGDQHPLDQVSLNAQFRAGKRLQLDMFTEEQIDAAHTELPLVFA